MGKKGLKMQKFAALIENFMREIGLKYRDRLLDDAINELIIYFGDLSLNTAYYELYKETYEKISGTPGQEDLYLTEEELFTLVIELCALHIYEWDFRMKEVLALLFAMRYSPENHKEDIEIWKELVNAIE